MYLARFLSNLFKHGGFILVDADNKEYIIGNPNKEKKLKLKLYDKKLHHKLLLYPDLYFGEAHADGKIDSSELNIIQYIIAEFFNLEKSEANSIIQHGLNELKNSTDLFSYGKILNENFTNF